MDESRLPLIGEKAPEFQAQTTKGAINFPDDFKGKWVVFFSHPADYTPVCTTEFIAFNKAYSEFQKRNCEVLGLSVDSIYSHISWIMNIEEKANEKIQFAVVGDAMGKVASLYGMLHPKASGSATVRAVFFIDPNGIIRAILYYPLTNGRNIKEIIRLLEALQKTDSDKVATPANWVSSKQVWEFDEEKVIVGAPLTVDGAKQRLSENYECIDWYLCFKK